MQDQSETKNSDEETPKICDFCQEASSELDQFNDCHHHICPLCLYRRIFCENLEELQNSDVAKINCKCSFGYMYKNLDEIETTIQKKNEIDQKRRNEKNQIKTIPRCKIHPAVFLDHYCVECCTVICKNCSKLNDNDHFEHRIIKCSKIIGTLTNEIASLKGLLGISEVGLFQVAFDEIASNVKKSAEKHFTKIVSQIEDLINSLIEFKNEYEASYKRELYRIVKTLKLYKQFYQNFYEDINEGTTSDDINFMRYINNANGILSKGTIENNEEVGKTLNNLKSHVEELKDTLKMPITAKFDFNELSRKYILENCIDTGHKGYIRAMIQTKNERIITCSSESMKVWTEDTESSEFKCTSDIKNFVGRITNLFELTDGRLVTTEEEEPTIKIWKETDKQKGYEIIQTLSGHTQEVNGVSQLKDGRLISCCKDGKMIIWKETEKEKNTDNTNNEDEKKGDTVFSVGQQIGENEFPLNIILSLFDNRIVTWGSDSFVRIWAEEEEGKFHFKCVHTLEGNNNLFTSIIQLTSEDLMMTMQKSRSVLWWKKTGQQFVATQRISGHTAEVTAVTECRDKRIATSCQDKMVRLFRYSGNDQTGYVLDLLVEEYIHGIYNLKQLRDGKLWATGTDKRLVSWRSRNDMY